jgi:hypothetical protein
MCQVLIRLFIEKIDRDAALPCGGGFGYAEPPLRSGFKTAALNHSATCLHEGKALSII